MSYVYPSSPGDGLFSAKKVNDNCSSNVRRVMLIGLEGVGKTTLINDLTGTKFETSDGKDGCKLQDEQIGSFIFEQYQIDLIDMIGMNCKDPGQWQKQLQGRSDVHGVIFYINGSNGRQSALGDLPRFADYCRNLAIPMLFLYRTGELNYFENHGASFEVQSQYVKTTGQVLYQNLDSITKLIVAKFKYHTKLHILIDPIECCKQINELKWKNQQLQQELEKSHGEVDKLQKKFITSHREVNNLQQELEKSHWEVDKLQQKFETSHREVNNLQQKLEKSGTDLRHLSVVYEKRLQQEKDTHTNLENEMKYKEQLYNNLVETQRQYVALMTKNNELMDKFVELGGRNDTRIRFVKIAIPFVILLLAGILFIYIDWP